MSWRDDKPTERQLEYISDMVEYGGCPKFEGTTKGEAADYISRYKQCASLMMADPWAIEHGYI